ncbi:MAG: hypothetical protein L0Z62_15770 [Gemmataceae bacterium]|nr:hypothetical protein [Gemmataceae bacterium]
MSMIRISAVLVVLIALMISPLLRSDTPTLGAQAGTPIAQQQLTDQQKKNEDFYKGRSTLCKHVNGARLQLKVTTVPKEDDADEIRLHWTLDYDGLRPPLTILRPSLGAWDGQTVLIWYAEGKDQRPYEYQVVSKILGAQGFVRPEKWQFVTVEKGKSVTETITYSAGRLFHYYTGTWPKQFGEAPPTVHIQLWHKPYERAPDLNLDPWTGELHSTVVKVPLKKWVPRKPGF